MQRQRHDLGGIEHVVDADIFVGLVGEIEDAGAVGDAVLEPADAVDVLLVVGAGRDHVFGLQAEHLADRLGDGADDRRVALGHGRAASSHRSRSS